MSDIPESAPISLPTIEPKTVDPKGQTLSNEQRQIISRCITKMTTARAKAYLTWDRDKLVARIAELEAQVKARDEVIVAAFATIRGFTMHRAVCNGTCHCDMTDILALIETARRLREALN